MIPENIKNIMKKLIENKYEAFICGGAVRDLFLHLEPKDWDIFTNATGEEILRIFPQGKVIGGEERQKKILTVIIDGVEVSQYRNNGDRTNTGNTLEEHVKTCDFTINGICMNINEEIIDLVNGEEDLELGILRFVGKPEDRVKEDSLRLFRGIRFATKYDLAIEDRKVFCEHKLYIKDLPKERIRDELLKIIVLKGGLRKLDKYNMLETIIPMFGKCKGLNGGHHHGESVDEHLLLAVDNALKLTNNPLLLLSIFLHDIGKPDSHEFKEVEDEELDTFYNHQNIGVDYVREWMKEYKFSEEEILYVSTMIKHHMMGKTSEISNSTFVKICDELEKAKVSPEDMIVLTYCDNQSNLTRPRLTFNEFIKGNGFIERYYKTKYETKGFNSNCLEINGYDIINAGFSPGPEIGRIKQIIFEKINEGIVVNRRDRLLELLKEMKE